MRTSILICLLSLFAGSAFADDITKAQDLVRDKLKDPYSAKFHEVHSSPAATDKQVGRVCGYVNAKNSFGAYVGKTLFAVVLMKNNDHGVYVSSSYITSSDRYFNTLMAEVICGK